MEHRSPYWGSLQHATGVVYSGRPATVCAHIVGKSTDPPGTPPKDEVRLVPLSDRSYVHRVESWLATARPKRREPLWRVTDETMRNWLKAAIARAADDDVYFSVPVTPHTFRHSFIMHMLYHRQPQKVVQALVGHKDTRSMEVYSRVFALDLAATLDVPFTGDGIDAASILRALPPMT